MEDTQYNGTLECDYELLEANEKLVVGTKDSDKVLRAKERYELLTFGLKVFCVCTALLYVVSLVEMMYYSSTGSPIIVPKTAILSSVVYHVEDEPLMVLQDPPHAANPSEKAMEEGRWQPPRVQLQAEIVGDEDEWDLHAEDDELQMPAEDDDTSSWDDAPEELYIVLFNSEGSDTDCDDKKNDDDRKNDDAVHLTEATFDDFVAEHEHVFVDFYAPWCIWSQKLHATWNELARTAQEENTYQVAFVDCVAEAELCRRMYVMAFPTLTWFHHASPMKPDYRSDRTVNAFQQYANSIMSGSDRLVKEVNSVQYEDHGEEPSWESYDMLFDRERVDELEVYDDEGEELDDLFSFDGSAVETLDLSDDQEGEEINDFFSFDESADDNDDGLEGESDDFAARNFIISQPIYFEADDETFFDDYLLLEGQDESNSFSSLDEIMQTSDHVFVNFCVDWAVYCERLSPAWDMFRRVVENVDELDLAVLTIDCTAEQQLCRDANIHSFPTLRWMERGSVKAHYREDRTVGGFIDFALDNLGKNKEADTGFL